MGQISADTFRRLYLLFVIGQFPKGSYGLKRLHKITYLSELGLPVPRPFEFKKFHFGQYSETLDEIKDQLLAMGLVNAVPLASAREFSLKVGENVFRFTEGGNRFFLSEKVRSISYEEVLESALPSLTGWVSTAMRPFMFQPEPELIRHCYSLPGFQQANLGDVVLESDVPAHLDVQLADDDSADLELALDPGVAQSLSRLVEVVDKTDFPLHRVETIELRATGT